jgi:hypothetical protein
MKFAHIIKILHLPHSKYQTDTSYLYYKKCGWWGKKILAKAEEYARDSDWQWLGISQFDSPDLFGFIAKYSFKNYILTLSEIYSVSVSNSQFTISLREDLYESTSDRWSGFYR